MRLGLGIALILLAAAAGCQPLPPPATKTPAAVKPASTGGAVNSADIKLTKADGKTLAATVAEHKGQVVFVDFWATWCGPCVEGFPHTVELSKKYKDQGLVTIAVSFDNLDNERAVREFLAKQGADFDNFLSKFDGVSQEAAVDFDVEALPQFRLYDRQGQRRFKWEGKADEIEAKIQELLTEKP